MNFEISVSYVNQLIIIYVVISTTMVYRLLFTAILGILDWLLFTTTGDGILAAHYHY